MERAIVDLHCDTIFSFLKGGNLEDSAGHINLDKLRRGGILAQCFALFIATEPDGSRARGGILTPWELYGKLLDIYRGEMERCAGSVRPAFTAEDVLRNDREGFISSILTVEDGVELDGRLERVDRLFADGVRMLALIWNYENSLGFPNSPDADRHALGLKPFGFEAVRRMNELGMIVDVSHLSEGGFWDVYRASEKPFAASHS